MKIIAFLYILLFSLICNAQSIKEDYANLISQVNAKREVFSHQFSATDSIGKSLIIREARNYLVNIMATDLFPYWYGTKWDFNGTTRIPQQGHIACGYFVTNTLTDVGFDIPRIKWAQSPSEVFIKKLSGKNIKRFSNKPISLVEDYLLNAGDGLYLVGLDSHTGFVYVSGDQTRFIHADYYEPEKGVVSEALDSHSPIAHSAYRVIGKLMSDEMMRSWIGEIKIN